MGRNGRMDGRIDWRWGCMYSTLMYAHTYPAERTDSTCWMYLQTLTHTRTRAHNTRHRHTRTHARIWHDMAWHGMTDTQTGGQTDRQAGRRSDMSVHGLRPSLRFSNYSSLVDRECSIYYSTLVHSIPYPMHWTSHISSWIYYILHIYCTLIQD